jgi:hypothetical protein
VNFLLVILLASILGFAHAQFGTGNANTFVDSVRQLFLLDHLRGGGGFCCVIRSENPRKKFFLTDCYVTKACHS